MPKNKPPDSMHLLLLEPSGIARREEADYISLPTSGGNLGLKPRRLDCAGAIVPGIVSWRTGGNERFAGVDEGMFTKCGEDVRVAVRKAITGDDLENLRQKVEEHFLKRSKEETQFRLALSKLEAAMMQHIARFSSEA